MYKIIDILLDAMHCNSNVVINTTDTSYGISANRIGNIAIHQDEMKLDSMIISYKSITSISTNAATFIPQGYNFIKG